MAKFPVLSSKKWLGAFLALVLTGLGLGAYVPAVPSVVELGCAAVESADGGDCEE